MQSFTLTITCLFTLAVAAYLGAGPQDETVKIRIRLVDASSGKDIAGIVRLMPADKDEGVALPGLFERMRGLSKPELALGWHVAPAGGAETTAPRGIYRLEAFAGLETGLTKIDVDLRKNAPDEIVIKLDYVFRPETFGLVAGNTHLHLKELTLDQADDYLLKIPPADGLKVLFISYLERVKDDLTYITNKYPVGDQEKLQAKGVLVNNGQEHRHNFDAYGEGYGHVMFLNIQKLVQPVSVGPGITGKGFDDLPLAPGIDNVRKQGGTVIWCHNNNGMEDIAHVLAGRIDALNVFDGSRTGTFEENYYRYLNIGVRLPISTGTDWFVYDFSRVYAKVPGKLTVPAWLDAFKKGHCQATNGPLLSLKVDGKDIGETLVLEKAKSVSIEASAVGRNDFRVLELVHNGKVIRTQKSAGKAPFTAKLTHEVRVEEPGWFAVRIARGGKNDPTNELDKPLFAHTSPVWVELPGRKQFDVEAAQALLKQVEQARGAIAAKGRFSAPETREKMLTFYDETMRELQTRINKRGQ